MPLKPSPTIKLETPFDHLTALLCDRFDAPFGLVSVVDKDLAVFRSELGLGERSLPREVSVSNILVSMGPGAHLVIEDAALHPVLKDHPMVAGPPFIRSFAGATISSSEGQPIGAVGIMDIHPRAPLTAVEIAVLHGVAQVAGSMLDQAAAQRVRVEQVDLLTMAEQIAGVGHFRVDAATGKVSWSDEVFRIHGLEPGAIDPTLHCAIGAYAPGDAEVVAGLVARSLATGEGYEARLRIIRPDGEERVTRAKARCELDGAGAVTALIGVFQDITDSVRAHEQIERSEALFRLMSETSTDIIARYKPDGTFLYLSPSVQNILGRPAEELIGRNCADIIHSDDISDTFEQMAARMDGSDDKAHVEFRALRADGSIVWLEASPQPVRDVLGKILEIHDHVRDVTARKVAQRAQAEMVSKLKLAETMAGIGSWRFDLVSGQVDWSDEVYRIHGYEPQGVDPTAAYASGGFHPDDNAMLAGLVERAVATGQGYECRLRLTRPDGGERITVTKAQCEYAANGQPAALFGVFQDITDSVRAHDAVAASEARYRLLADRASDIIVTYGVDGLVRYISPSIETATGLKPADLLGRPVTDLILAEDVPALAERFRHMVKAPVGEPTTGFRYRGVDVEGESRWFEARTSLIRDELGRVVEFQDVVRDVTDTKALEDQLIASRDVAEAGARAKSEFLANMSHELRTPLTSVIGFSGLLRDSDNLPAAERIYADRIATASDALLSVINDILDYSKLEADAVDLEPQPFDPRAMAQGAAAILEDLCRIKGLTLLVEAADDLAPALMGDEGRLRQVTLNLLSNAVKFTGAGTVTLRVSDAAGRLRVTVTDSGIGIPPDKIDTLFDRFTQADTSTTRVYGGTGLGLAISRRLIERMGGVIGADSTPGEGSIFWFEVPLNAAGTEAAVTAPALADLPSGVRILIADDAPANRELVTAILAGFDLDLETVQDGAEAVEAARTGGYDLILMDVHMPVMDGLDATRAIRAMGGRVSRTPIVALTANVQPEQVERCRDAGMDAHVGKPIQVGELLQTIVTALARRAGEEGQEVAA